jgi:hypothetical protein
MILPILYAFLLGILFMVRSRLDAYINDELPPNTHRFKHRIMLAGDPKDPNKVITGIPLIHNETKQLIAFVELKWEKDDYKREL